MGQYFQPHPIIKDQIPILGAITSQSSTDFRVDAFFTQFVSKLQHRCQVDPARCTLLNCLSTATLNCAAIFQHASIDAIPLPSFLWFRFSSAAMCCSSGAEKISDHRGFFFPQFPQHLMQHNHRFEQVPACYLTHIRNTQQDTLTLEWKGSSFAVQSVA